MYLIFNNSLLFVILAHGIVSIYEIAVKQTPKNEEFLSHLFMACVRVRNHSKQQQVKLLYLALLPI